MGYSTIWVLQTNMLKYWQQNTILFKIRSSFREISIPFSIFDCSTPSRSVLVSLTQSCVDCVFPYVFTQSN